MKLWILNTFFKKELTKLAELSLKMQAYDKMSEWDKGFVCGLHHATQELLHGLLIKEQ